MSFVPLLSAKPLEQWAPEEYKTYVRSLYHKRTPRRATKKIKVVKTVIWSLTKKGNLSIRIRREPKWLTREEIDLIAEESGKPANEVWLKVTAKKSGIKVSTAEEEKRIAEDLRDLETVLPDGETINVDK